MEERSTTYRVMIVDDEAILRTGMLHLCNWSEYGIEIVAQASNGQEALQYIEQVHPHVVITDIVMPIMDGVEFSKMMRMQYPEIKLVVLSSYSEFDYVREVFKYGVTDYLLKPKVSAPELISLIHSLCSNMNLVDVGFNPINDPALVLGSLLGSEGNDDAEAWSKLQEHFTSNHFRMIKASTSLLLSKTKWTQSQMEQILIELAEEELSSFNYVCVFLKNECLLLINYESEQAEQVLSSLYRFTQKAKQSLSYMMFVLSNAFEELIDMKKKHEQLTLCLGKLFYFYQQSCIPEREIHLETDKINFDHTQFTTSLRILALDKAIDQLKAFFLSIQENQDYDEYSLKRFCQNLIYTVTSTLEQMKQPLTELSSSKLKIFKMIDLAFDINELEMILTQYLNELKAVIDRHTDPQSSIILNQIYEYVNDNYANEISLSELATQLHLNYSYLSTYFKQRTNENLTAFINRVRTDKAKDLLLNQELSISEISRLTGFSEHNYFSKVFKKMTGMTPVEYRNHISQ